MPNSSAPPTNHLDIAVQELLRTHGLSARDLGAQSGVHHSVFSRLAAIRLDSGSLRKLLAWCKTTADADRLLAAYLWDEIGRAGVDAQDFWTRVANGDNAWLAELPPDIQGSLATLGSAANNDYRLAGLLQSMAERTLLDLAREHDAKASRAKRKGKATAPAAGAAAAPPVPSPAKAS